MKKMIIFDELEQKILEYHAEWGAKTLSPWLRAGDRVLNVGAGDCRLDRIIADSVEVQSIDVSDFNATDRSLTVYDGEHIPYEEKSFDVVLLLFVLHHAANPEKVLNEAKRVCRGRIIVFEDINETRWDKWTFRAFHRLLHWSQGIPLPYHEWDFVAGRNWHRI